MVSELDYSILTFGEFKQKLAPLLPGTKNGGFEPSLLSGYPLQFFYTAFWLSPSFVGVANRFRLRSVCFPVLRFAP